MSELVKLFWICVACGLLILWLGVPSSGQPFHEPGQSDRSVIFEG
jgi:hypothetical protein